MPLELNLSGGRSTLVGSALILTRIVHVSVKGESSQVNRDLCVPCVCVCGSEGVYELFALGPKADLTDLALCTGRVPRILN